MKLYSYWRSTCSWRVRIGLALKGLDYEYIAVHLRDGQQSAADHLQRNSLAQVPVLELSNSAGQVHQVSQSLAILELLDELHAEPPLLPREPYAKARVRELAELVNAGIQPLQNFGVLQQVKRVGGDPKSWSAHFIGKGLLALEAKKSQIPGKFLVGDEVTLADICLVPQLFNARRFGVDMGGLGELLKVEEACSELEAFAEARPERQPDAETEAPK